MQLLFTFVAHTVHIYDIYYMYDVKVFSIFTTDGNARGLDLCVAPCVLAINDLSAVG